MSSIYGAGFANFTPNVLGTQELTTAIQSAISSTGTTSRTNEDLILETKTANNVVVKANNTTVATFSANPTTDPRMTLSGTSPDIVITANSPETSLLTIPRLQITNTNTTNKTLFLGVPGGTSAPAIGTSFERLGFVTNYSTRMVLQGYALQLYNPTASVTLNWQNTLSNYTLSLPPQLPPFEQSLQVNQTGAMSYRSTFIPVAFSNATSNEVTTVQSAAPPQVWPEVVYVATIPANAMGTNGMLKIAMAVRKSNTLNDIFFGVAASTNNTMSIVGDLRLMGAVGTIPYGQRITSANASYFVDNFYLYLDNSTSVLKHRTSPLAGLSTGTYETATIDTTQTWYLKVFLSTANAATSAFLESILVETLYA